MPSASDRDRGCGGPRGTAELPPWVAIAHPCRGLMSSCRLHAGIPDEPKCICICVCMCIHMCRRYLCRLSRHVARRNRDVDIRCTERHVDILAGSRHVHAHGDRLLKGANIFNGHSGIRHLHYAHLAHYHMPRNTNCDPLGCVGVRQCKKPRQSNLFRLR